MGLKLLWTGATLILASDKWNPASIPAVGVVGAVLMLIGLLCLWLDK